MSKKKVTIIDYGLGNLFSIKRALEVSGANEVEISSSSEVISKADRLILPGVGAFANGMNGLRSKGLVDVILDYANSERPLLGICLGMQMLTTVSEEFGEHEGLNLIPGRVKPIPRSGVEGQLIKVPNVGWHSLQSDNYHSWTDTILCGITPRNYVYFVHSYQVETILPTDSLSFTLYGGHKISAVIKRNNIYGCQFHPEKSGEIGLKILSQFIST